MVKIGAASGSFYFDDYDKYGYVVQKWVDTPFFLVSYPRWVYGWWDISVQACRFVRTATTLLAMMPILPRIILWNRERTILSM